MMSFVQLGMGARLGASVRVGMRIGLGAVALVCGTMQAQTGAQLGFAGLRAVASGGIPEGQINAVKANAQGNVFLLVDQKDGVRVLKMDANATTVLAQAQIGAKGDIGLAMALDPAGNVYVTGTTTSGALTATAGAAFPAASGTATNSFVAKFDANLNIYFVSFAGGGFMAASSIAATADAVFIAGSIYSATLPVTAAGIIQTPAFGSTANGFVERFAANGSSLVYATYLSGANGSTTVAAVAADSSDNAYVAGTTTAPGYPTVAALVPAVLGATSGFVTKLTPAGDGISFSTFIPGAGVSSVAIDSAAGNLLVAGSVALGQFPVATVQAPVVNANYQVLLRLALDGSSVAASTLLAPGSQSFVAAGPSGTAWVDGSLSLSLLAVTPLEGFGNSFAVRVNAAGAVDQAARFGGLAPASPGFAGAPVNLTSVATDAAGQPLVAGAFAPYAGSGLLATETFDLPLVSAPTAALPSTVRAAVLAASACNGSLCSGSAGYLAKLTLPGSGVAAGPALALSVDDAPNVTVRNLGSGQATGVQVAVTGFGETTNCGTTLAAGAECSIALSGSGLGSVTVSAANNVAQTQALQAVVAGVAAQGVVFSPKELDFGIVSAASGAVTRTITVTNLTQQSQTFASALDVSAKTTLAYNFAEQTSDCASAGSGMKVLAVGGVCHITIGLTASSSAANDGAIQQNWLIGSRDVQMTAYGQAAALAVSAGAVDFGTQFTAGLRVPRYLYLSNSSTAAVAHAAVTLPATSPFTVVDRCPAMLEPRTVCQMQLGYQNAHTPAADAVTLSLDQGMTVLVTGRSLPQPSANGASVNPNLSVSATTLNFATPVVVTGVSSAVQTLTVTNTGASAFALGLALSGDFTDTTSCGATLAAGASCSVVVSFAPSGPGTRQGLLAVTAGAGTTPAYVTLTGVGTGILSPTTNGTIDFGSVIAGQPSVLWFKVTQPFTSFAFATASATLGSPYTAVLVEDIGYGHGQPASSAYSTAATGTCFNCWVGVRFVPQAVGAETGTLMLSSVAGGSAYVLSLTGNGLPLTGLLLTPVAQDFGPVTVNSTSAPMGVVLTNLSAGQGAVTVSAPVVTGDFAVSSTPSGGAACGGTLAYAASCVVEVQFAPTATGPRAGTLTVQVGTSSVATSLTGYGENDPGVAFSPAAVVFNNVPGAGSTVQQVQVTNTGTSALQVGTPTATTTSSTGASFTAASGCGALAAGASCYVSVSFVASTAQAVGTLTVPVTTSAGLTNYTVALTGAYTTEDAGLAIVPGEVQYGPQATGAVGLTRQFTIDNLTSKSLVLSVALPRQYVLQGPACSGLAPGASCNFSVAFLPLANGDITGTLFAQATPSDGSATLNGLGYVEGYGVGAGSLSVTGGLLPGAVLPFGQVPSGQSAVKTLTLTNASSTLPLTVRRITSGWPFLSTTTCGGTLAHGASCTVTMTYTPLNQVAAGSTGPPTTADTGTLVIESDAASSPDLIDLTGTSTPATVAAPGNAAPLAALTASTSSLTFAATQAGNVSAPQTVTLANTGTAILHVLGLQTTADFTVTSNCGTVVPGGSCTLTVTFTPQNAGQTGSGAGTRVGAIEIASDASTSLEFVSLVGAGNASTLQLAPSALTFGTVLVGATATLPVTVSNTGNAAATFGTASATGDYSVATGTCPAAGLALAAGASCAVQVTFAPTVSGTRSGTVSLASSATTLPLVVPVTGTGAQSHLTISPGSLAFGTVAVNGAASLSLTLANTGTAAITSVSLAATGDYAVSVPCALTTLAAGSSCSVTVTFTPTATGARNGTLTVTSSDATSPAVVTLTGAGVLNGGITLTVNGGASASVTVKSGTAATYGLSVAPVNGFTGLVVLNCTPVNAADFGYCSLLPSSLTLSTGAQSSVATLNTVTSIAANDGFGGRFGGAALGLLFPALFLGWKAKTSQRRVWRRVAPVAWAFFASVVLAGAMGCGGGSAAPSNLRYASAGTYQYQVTASGVSGGTPVSQTVTLNLTVQ